ncbi:MAG: hypothetical protein OEW15_14700 [Nitrospirota bacterium]|nr:hypothetical protein [Nitrospirota bacterium]
MKRVLLFIACCLALSLMLQNTCPFGAAGKSSVVSKCEGCPLRRLCHRPVPTAPGPMLSGSTTHRFPQFLFTAARLCPGIQVSAVKALASFLAVHFAEAHPAEILKPPSA